MPELSDRPHVWIALSDSRFLYICGVAQWIMDLFRRVGYLRPSAYDRSFLLKVAYHIRTVLFISAHFVLLGTLEILAIYMYRDDVSRVLGAAFIFSANATHGIKLMNLIAKRDKFVGLTDYFVTELSKQNLKDSAVLQIIIAFEKVSFRDLTLVLSCTCVAVASLAGLGDLMDSTGLPLVAYYPFEIQYSPVYELVYVHQMVAVLIAAAFNVLLDIFSTNLVIQMCCQFRLLKREIKAIQQISPSDHEAVALRLQAVIERQCVLTKRCSDLSEIYGVPILGQFLGSILIICLGFDQFYRASEMNFYTLFSTLITIMWALMQAFFYCLHGNEIKTESESLGDVVMELPWYSYSPANKRKVLFMVHMGQRPTVLRAAGLINITLAALMTIIKTSYSAFSVIANMEKE